MADAPLIVDLRSDTITQPTPAMRQAMAEAQVGDDVFGEDPTVNALEERVAEMFGKQAALLVASGTMANQVAIRAHTQPGDEIICEATSHIYLYEGGAPAALSGCSYALLDGDRGMFTAAQAAAAIRGDNVHYPRTRLMVLENTHNRGGGSVWPVEQVADVCDVAKHAELATHMDGARIMNACLTAGAKPVDYAKHVDSCTICFSKGLGAPVGSAVVGSREFIGRARRVRKMFGGGMRQAGILAAAAMYALDHHVDRLVDDHVRARRLATEFGEIPGLIVNPDAVQTNIVLLDLDDRLGPADRFVQALADAGVLMLATGPRRVRAVVSLAVDEAGIDRAIKVFHQAWR